MQGRANSESRHQSEIMALVYTLENTSPPRFSIPFTYLRPSRGAILNRTVNKFIRPGNYLKKKDIWSGMVQCRGPAMRVSNSLLTAFGHPLDGSS